MEYISLGKTGLNVSKLCFGALTIGPLQANLTIDNGAQVIIEAMKNGVNFVDSAQIYGTYPYIKRAIKKSSIKPIIATKTYAYDKKMAQQSLEQARREMDIDFVDIFLLHEQESIHTINGHREAIEYFLNAKNKGLIKAFGISTHHIEAVKCAIDLDEIEIIHPIINIAGIGICDGGIDEMIKYVTIAYEKGKGIYSMKPLGGGNLIGSYDEALKYVLDLKCVHSVAMGMQSIDEVSMNISVFNGQKVSEDTLNKIKTSKRKLHIEGWCEGCGKCLEKCGQKALSLEKDNNNSFKAVVNANKCVLCGYCCRSCELFAIKVY